MPRLRAAIVLVTALGGACRPATGSTTTEPAPPTAEPEASATGLAALSWLAGTWRSEETIGPVTVEHWLPPDGGSMLAVNRTVADGKTMFFEFLRIETRDDGLVYLASPLGRDPPTPFPAVEQGAGWVAFENPDHDYPQRIEYRRDGDRLTMTISGQQDGAAKASRWTMVKIEPGLP